ncbi:MULTISPECIES: hypothetical protein [Thiomonas]|jgi:hypothetical protein|uniref:hypothetical protein n=1 Tax=Thiomonas TaxID=32012 RepID=UPI001AD0164C|nr:MULTISPECIES: hypothetical protein [Thiomonas]MBN8777149.1 hypothetical protein [Thiomonas arsenitoxydans]HML80611.1 hypothetical protein [Thiomonas arsenitoxydans]
MAWNMDGHFYIQVERWVFDSIRRAIKQDLAETVNPNNGKIITRPLSKKEQCRIIDDCETHIFWLTRTWGVEQVVDQMLSSISSLRGRHLTYFKAGHYAVLWALLMECQTSMQYVHLTYYQESDDVFYQDYRGAQIIPFTAPAKDRK